MFRVASYSSDVGLKKVSLTPQLRSLSPGGLFKGFCHVQPPQITTISGFLVDLLVLVLPQLPFPPILVHFSLYKRTHIFIVFSYDRTNILAVSNSTELLL